jgi:hypothetical protein
MKSRGSKKITSEVSSDKLVSSKSHQRNLATMYALVAYNPFQVEINKIRHDLKIGTNGMHTESGQSWSEWALEVTEEIYDSKQYRESSKRIIEETKAGLLGSRARKNRVHLLNASVPQKQIEQEIDYLINKFNLPLNFYDHIKSYIFFNQISAPQHNYSPTISFDLNDRRSLTITIYTKLTEDEIKELNYYIQLFGKDNLIKYNDAKNVRLASEIKIAHADRTYIDPQTGIVRKATLADLAEEYLGSRKEALQVSAMLRDLAKLQKDRFGNMRKRRR